MEDACTVFNKMQYSGYAMHGHGKEALQHFEMCEEGVQPDDVTLVCVLSACNHAGLVVEGLCYYLSMSIIYKISAKLEHYTCMVNLLGHAGHLQEAENMIKVMPCNPNMVV
jgi:pentatricopeptide repeat protein